MGDTGLFVACAGIENSDPRDFQASAMRSIRLNSSVEEVVAFPDKFSNRDFCFTPITNSDVVEMQSRETKIPPQETQKRLSCRVQYS